MMSQPTQCYKKIPYCDGMSVDEFGVDDDGGNIRNYQTNKTSRSGDRCNVKVKLVS